MKITLNFYSILALVPVFGFPLWALAMSGQQMEIHKPGETYGPEPAFVLFGITSTIGLLCYIAGRVDGRKDV